MTTSATPKTVTLSVKNVPEALAERLRQRAKRNHRSLQGELLAILEEADTSKLERPQATVRELWEQARELGLADPSEAAALVRADRDAH